MSQLNLFDQRAVAERQTTFLGVPGLTYARGVLSRDEQDRVLAEVDAHSWASDLKRRVQHYGYKYDYKARAIDQSMFVGPLPPFAVEVARKLLALGLMAELPDQLIVNEYEPGQGITPHVDCEPCFKDTIATVSLGWAYEMEFLEVGSEAVRAALLEPGSALILSGDARYKWRHCIRQRRSDHGVARRRRVSLTFRNVIL
jgi:alkylated DNA repair dioxygenase AlkB